jgi:pre ATP-grasp domain-containing protein
MPRIILPNFRTDYSEQVREWSGFVKGTKSGSDTSARFLWHADEGDVIVIPDGIDPGFKAYVGGIAGFAPGSVEVLITDQSLDEATLQDEGFAAELRSFVKGPSEWSLFPCVVTRGTAELAARLGFDALPGSDFARQSGIDMLNMKSTFRRLAAGVGTPIAEGVVARSPGEIHRAVMSLSRHTRMMIAKQDRSGGGHGNIGLAGSPSAWLPGTRETRLLGADLGELAERLWSDLSDAHNQLVVVEAYHPAGHRFYLEFHVRDDGVEFLNGGMLRYAPPPDAIGGSPKWVGLDLPLRLGSRSSVEVTIRAHEFLDVIRRIGYRGYANIDGLLLPDGRLMFHEINARWGGSLVYHVIAERLLGRNYADSHAVSSVLNIRPGPLSRLVEAIGQAGIGYRADKREGVVVLGCDSDLGPGAECLILAASEERTRKLEADLRGCTE